MIELMPGDERRLALEQDDVTMAVLLRVDFPPAGGGVKLYTDAADDIEVDGLTYSAESGLIGLEPPSGQGDIDRHVMGVTWLDPLEPKPTMEDRFTAGGYTGIRLGVQVVFVLDSGSLTRPLTVYKGRCVQVASPFDAERGRLLQAKFAGPLARLDNDASIVTSHVQQQRRRSGDTSLAYAHVAQDIPWGREVGGDSGGDAPRRTGPNR